LNVKITLDFLRGMDTMPRSIFLIVIVENVLAFSVALASRISSNDLRVLKTECKPPEVPDIPTKLKSLLRVHKSHYQQMVRVI
jgi:hypothetical protein